MGETLKPSLKKRIRRKWYLLVALIIVVLTVFSDFPWVLGRHFDPLAGFCVAVLVVLLGWKDVIARWWGLPGELKKKKVGEKKILPRIKKGKEDYEGIKDYLVLGYDEETGEEVRWDNGKQVRHMLVVGSTGTGKSSFLFSLLWQQVMRGGGVIYIDGQRNLEALTKIIWMCQEAGILERLKVFDPKAPKRAGHTYNPLLKGKLEANVTKVMKLLPPIPAGSDADYYKNRIYYTTKVLLGALQKVGKPYTAQDLLCLYAMPDLAFPVLLDELKQYGARDEVLQLRGLIHEVKSAKDFTDKCSNMLHQIGSVAKDRSAKFLNTPSSDIDLYEAIKRNQIIYFALPRMSDPGTSERIGRFLLADIQDAIARVCEEEEGKLPCPFLILLDEFGSYADPDFAVVFEQARKAGFSVVAGVQSLANLREPLLGLSKEFMDRVMANAVTKVYFGVRDADTAEEAARVIGQDLTYMRSLSQMKAEAITGRFTSPSRFFDPSSNEREALTEGYREAYDYKVRPEVLLHELNQRGRVIVDFGDGNPIFARTAWLDISLPPKVIYEKVAKSLPEFDRTTDTALNLYLKVMEKLSAMPYISFVESKKEKETEESGSVAVLAKAEGGVCYYAYLVEKEGKAAVKQADCLFLPDAEEALYRAVAKGLASASELGVKDVTVSCPSKGIVRRLREGKVDKGHEKDYKAVKKAEQGFSKVSYREQVPPERLKELEGLCEEAAKEAREAKGDDASWFSDVLG